MMDRERQAIMILSPEIIKFFEAIREDNRINPVHISLFMAIMQHRNDKGRNPICVFSKDLMQLAKISGVATYHRSIKELHEYGYIQYQPSYDRFVGSLIFISDK